MYEGFLMFGGNEVVNSARTYGYLNSGECPTNWIVCPPCDGIQEATQAGPYTMENIVDAPWYDTEDESSHRFMGIHGISFEGLSDSTREATIQEGITDGGVIGQVRRAVRQVRVRAMLSALGEDALEYGMSYLKSALNPRDCVPLGLPGIRTPGCGVGDVNFFLACPPTSTSITKPETVWNDPLTNLAVNPSFENPVTFPSEVYRNLVTNPSFEATSGTVEVRRNWLVNPRMENNITGWAVVAPNTQVAAVGGTLVTLPTAIATSSVVLYNAVAATSAASEQAYAAVDITVPVGQPAQTFTVRIQPYLSGGGSSDGLGQTSPPVTIQPGQTARLTSPVHTAAATSVGGWRIWVNVTSAPAGAQFTVRNAMLEKAPINTVPYFDGTTAAAGDFTYAWTGTADNSASIQNGVAVATVSTTQPPAYQSGTWQNNGAKSLAVIAAAGATTDFKYIPTATLKPSTTYTAVATIRTGASTALGRALQIAESGAPARVLATLRSTSALNGVETVRVTFTTPADVVAARWLMPRAVTPGVTVFYDSFLLVEGVYTGPYFDGATPLADADTVTAWSGTANASASTVTGQSPNGYPNNDSNSRGITTAAWAASGTKSLRIIPTGSSNDSSRLGTLGSMGMQSGKTYTVLATVHVPTALTGTLNARALSLMIDPDISADVIATAPNTPGDHPLRITFTLDGIDIHNGTQLRLYNGASGGGGDVYWDNIAVVEGNFQGEYFDGDGTDSTDPPVEYAWTGTPHASTSTWRTGYIVQVPDEERYDEIIFNLGRNLHSVTCISGPLVEQKLHRGALWGYVVEFTLAAGVPYIFGETRSVDAGDQIPVVVQDVPFNLVPYPSAELASGTVTAATNFSNNPSVELDLTNWSSAASSVTAQTVLSQGDTAAGGLAANGTKSAKARFTATSGGTAGTLRVDNTSATFTATVAGDRMSVNMWATPILVSGTAVLGTLNIYAIWRAGSTVLSTDLVGAAPSGGGAVSKKSMPIPATATNVIIRAELNLTSWSTGAVVDLYADAVAVTRP